MLKNAEKFVGHFGLGPEEALQALHPFEVGNDDASSVAKNIWNYEHLVPVFFENYIRCRRRWTIGSLGQNATLDFACIRFVDHPIDRCRHEHVARKNEQFLWIDMIVLIESLERSIFQNMLLGRLHVDAFWILEGGVCSTDPDHLDAALECERKRCDGADITEPLHDGRTFVGIDFQHVHSALDQVNDTASGRFPSAF